MTTTLLKAHPDTDLLAGYKAAMRRLDDAPGDRAAQHRAVLCLARLGATDAALRAYDLYGLADVGGYIRRAEDYLALGARIYKDLFLRASGPKARGYGLKSAALYTDAFERTGGYYSAINAATMMRLTGGDDGAVRERAIRVLAQLPDADTLTPTDHYYVEATRAEAYLLLGDNDRAEAALRGAMRFDPLNYMAHATTQKQLRLIIAQQSGSDLWLEDLRPPRPISFAGHMWTDRPPAWEIELQRALSDVIQTRDVGFAYGALAAGADIVMAESFLSDGAALHVVLPGTVEVFKARSVAPSGGDWAARYSACLDAAASVMIVPDLPNDDDGAQTIRLAADVAMGQAILRARNVSRDPALMLCLDEDRAPTLSHRLRTIWTRAGYETVTVPVALGPPPGRAAQPDIMSLPLVIMTDEGAQRETVRGADGLLALAEKLRPEHPAQAMAIGLDHADADGDLSAYLAEAVPGGLLLSDALAALMTLSNPADRRLTYAGCVAGGRHVYSLAL